MITGLTIPRRDAGTDIKQDMSLFYSPSPNLDVNAMSWYGSHDYLNEFIRENHCRRIMEVGVYNGENAVSMVKAAIKNRPPSEVMYHGFDFFSSYSTERIGRKLDETACRYKLFEGNTMATIPEAAKTLQAMDIIFIDGGKSFKEAWSDWEGSSKLMHEGTGVFVHNVDFSGVGKMVDSIPDDRYEVEISYPRFEGKVALIRKKASE
jgi:predicted O-methyltransferase YrrM